MTQFLIRCFIKHPEDTASPAVRTAYGNLASVVGMACNLLLCLGKLAAGTLFGSIAIMADALNNLSDAPPTWSAWWGSAWRPKPRTKNTPTAMHGTSTWPDWWSVSPFWASGFLC